MNLRFLDLALRRATRTVVLVGGLLLMGAGWTSAADPVFSLRVLPTASAVEGELHLGSVGVSVALVQASFSGCSNLDRQIVVPAARYFFGGPQNNFYAGVWVTKQYTTLGCTIIEELTVPLPMVGYHWLFSNGINVDLGLRPGILGIGYSF